MTNVQSINPLGNSSSGPLEDAFYYRQDIQDGNVLEDYLTQVNVLTLLKTTYVYIINTPSQQGMLLAPLVIEKKYTPKRLFQKQSPMTSITCNELFPITATQATDSEFAHNVRLMIHYMVNEKMPWHGDKNEAIRHANHINYLFKRVALTTSIIKNYQLKTESLYDFLDTLTPNIQQYISQMTHQSLTFTEGD